MTRHAIRLSTGRERFLLSKNRGFWVEVERTGTPSSRSGLRLIMPVRQQPSVQVNREHALLQEVGEIEEEKPDEASQRLEAVEEKLSTVQEQVADLLRLQEALVRELLPKDSARQLLAPPVKEDP